MQLDEMVTLDDLSNEEVCSPYLIKLEQVAILIGVRQRLSQNEVSLFKSA